MIRVGFGEVEGGEGGRKREKGMVEFDVKIEIDKSRRKRVNRVIEISAKSEMSKERRE